MHQNAPLPDKKSKLFLGRGTTPYPDPPPLERRIPPPQTQPPSAPLAPRLSPSALGVPVPFHLRLEHWVWTMCPKILGVKSTNTEILGAWIWLLNLNEKKIKSLLLENYLADHDKIFIGGTHHEWGFVGSPMAHPNKSKMAAAAIFNFGKNINNSGLDKDICTKLHGKMHQRHAEMTTWPKVETGS